MPEKRPSQGRKPLRSTPLARSGALTRNTELKRTNGLQRSAELARSAALERTSTIARKTRPKRQPISPASPAQRAKIRGKPCVVCGAPATTPMHVWPRGTGGCDDPLCVLPACWRCHRDYDEKRLELLPHIVADYLAEIAHAHLHAPPIAVLERLTASKVVLHSLIRRPPPLGGASGDGDLASTTQPSEDPRE